MWATGLVGSGVDVVGLGVGGGGCAEEGQEGSGIPGRGEGGLERAIAQKGQDGSVMLWLGGIGRRFFGMGESCGRNMVREEDVMGVEIVPGQEMSSRLSRTNRFQLAAF